MPTETEKPTEVIAQVPMKDAAPVVETPPTPAELAEQTKRTMEALGYKYNEPGEEKPTKEGETPAKREAKPEPEKPAKPEKPDKKVETQAKPDKPSEAKEKPLKKADPAPAAQPRIDEESLAERVAAKMDARAHADKTTGPPKTEELSDEDTSSRAVLTVLAENPKYKHIVNDFDKFVGQERKYRSDWEKANPGKTFNADDEDHTDFYDKNEPRYAENDFIRAEAKLEARTETAKAMSERDEKDRFTSVVNQARERVKEVREEAVTNLIAEISDEKDIKTIDKLRENDPVAAAVLETSTGQLQALTQELELWYTKGLGYKADQNNPLHADLLQRMYKYENELLSLQEEEREWKGKSFTPIEVYNHMTPAEQKQHWTIWLEPQQVKKLLVADFAQHAKKFLSMIRPEKSGSAPKTSKTSALAAALGTQEVIASAGAAATEKKTYPSSAGGDERVPTPGMIDNSSKSDAEKITSILFG